MLKPFADRYDSMRALVETALDFTVANGEQIVALRRAAKDRAAPAASGRSTGRWTNRIRPPSASRVMRPSTGQRAGQLPAPVLRPQRAVGKGHRLLQPLPVPISPCRRRAPTWCRSLARGDRAPAVERRGDGARRRRQQVVGAVLPHRVRHLAPQRLRRPYVPRRRAARARAGTVTCAPATTSCRWTRTTPATPSRRWSRKGHDSFFRWGFFNSVLEKKEAYSDYVFEDEADANCWRPSRNWPRSSRRGRPPIRRCCPTRTRCWTSSSPTARATRAGMAPLSGAMHYALAPRTFLFSHYFYTGLRIATGIVGLTYLTYAFADLPTAMAVAIGALCTSLMDLPSPLRHKFNEMLAACCCAHWWPCWSACVRRCTWLLRTSSCSSASWPA
jgi:hypothetical protein